MHPAAVHDSCALDDPDLLLLRPYLLEAGLWVLAYDPWVVWFGRQDYAPRMRHGTAGRCYVHAFVSRVLLEDEAMVRWAVPDMLAAARARWDAVAAE